MWPKKGQFKQTNADNSLPRSCAQVLPSFTHVASCRHVAIITMANTEVVIYNAMDIHFAGRETYIVLAHGMTTGFGLISNPA